MKTARQIFIAFTFLYFFQCASPDAKKNTYQANWESLKQYTVPEWLRDAKFGIWTCWGIYSVPAFGRNAT